MRRRRKAVQVACLHVLGDVALERGAVGAEHARKGLLPRVSEQVLLQVIRSAEESTTN